MKLSVFMWVSKNKGYIGEISMDDKGLRAADPKLIFCMWHVEELFICELNLYLQDSASKHLYDKVNDLCMETCRYVIECRYIVKIYTVHCTV